MNKKVISALLSVSIAAASFPVLNFSAMAAYGGGDGTEGNPYQISTVAELKELRDSVNSGTDYDGKYFKLVNNLDLAGESWTPIGVYMEDESVNLGNPFKGSFNGGGKTISGLNINSQNNAGLFGYLYDADISSVAVKGIVQGNQNAGGIAGYSRNSRIMYCVNYCAVTGNTDNTGGIAGYIHKVDDDIEASVKNCYNKGVIIGTGDTGGIVGESLNGGVIENCYNVGAVTGTEMNTGGIVGYENGRSTVLRCYNYANVKGASGTGEIIGRRAYDAKTDYCYYLEGGESEAIGNVGDTARVRERTAEEFADAENTEDDFIDWDFDNIWIMSEALKRPVLRYSIPEPYLTVHYILQKNDGVWENTDAKQEYYETAEVFPADKSFENYTLTGYSTGEYKNEAEREITYPTSNIPLNTGVAELYLYYTLDTQKLVFYSDSEGTEIDTTENIILGASLAQYANKTLAEKQGYTFAGWSYEKNQSYYKTKNGEVNENLIEWANLTMPGGTLNVYPIWVRDRLNVKLNLDDDAGIDESQSKDFNVDIDEKLQMNKMNAATREGYTLDGWYTQNGVKWNADYGVTPEYCDKNDDGTPIIKTEADRKYKYYTVTLTSKWTPIKVSVSYELNGGSGDIADTGKYGLGDIITIKSAPTAPEGKSFIGWSDKNGTSHSANEFFAFDDWSVTENNIITLTAVYKEIPQNSIKFDTDGGTAVEPVTDHVGTEVGLTGKITAKTGHTFDGWYYNGVKVTTIDIGDTQKTVTAHWNINKYIITFETNGADAVAPITQNYGTAVTKPADPTKEHYTFAGWDSEIPETMPARNMTISALWTPMEYTITFDTDGGSETAPIKGIYGSRIEKPQDPTKDGFDFDGWDTEIPTYMPDTNPTIKAKWKEKTAEPTAAPTATPRRGGGGSKSTPTPTPSPTPTPTPASSSHSGAKLIEKDPYVAGYEDGSFRPDNPIKRAELVTMLARLMTNKFDGYTSAFPDAKGIWSERFVGYLESYNILVGYEDGTFRPENYITRAEMAVMMAKLNEYDLTASISRAGIGFSDIDESYTKWAAASAIKQLTEAGIITGYEDGSFRPASSVTRAEAVAIINRTIDNMEIEKITAVPNDVSESHWAYNDILFSMNKRKNK